MKKVKKIFSFLLAMTMTLAMGISAAAGSSSVTINNATVEKKYTLYKVFDATFSGGSGGNAAYKISSSDGWYSAVSAADSPFELTQIGNSDVYNVALKNGQTSTEVSTWFQDKVASATGGSEKTATSATVTWENLDDGYYVIKRGDGTVVTLKNVNGAVTVIDKNDSPGWTDPENPDGDPSGGGKKVSDEADGTYGENSSAQIGDTVYFKVGAHVPKYNGDKLVTEYTFTDELASGLKLVDNSVKVKDTQGKDLDAQLYTVTKTADGFTLKLNNRHEATYPTGDNIVIWYQATVEKDAVYDNQNTISMTWKEVTPDPTDPTQPGGNETDPDPDDTPDNSTTHTYVYGFELQKYKESVAEANKLTGAEFNLLDADGKAIELVKNNENYRVATTEDQNKVTTIEAGYAKIFGLKDGTTYTLKETKAPDGYNLLTSDKSVQITAAEDTDKDGYMDDEISIINQAGAELPSTGGIGTTIFYVIGSMLMIGAAVLLVTRKKMSVSND